MGAIPSLPNTPSRSAQGHIGRVRCADLTVSQLCWMLCCRNSGKMLRNVAVAQLQTRSTWARGRTMIASGHFEWIPLSFLFWNVIFLLVPVIWFSARFIRLVRIIAKSAYQLRHVRLSVHMYNDFGSHLTDSREILYWVFTTKIYRETPDLI